MKFELHCHTWHSRGSKIPTEALCSPECIFRVLKKRGFGGVAITDHDTTQNWKDAKKAARKFGMLFIPGLEISTKSGHLIGLGLNEKVKSGMTVDETVDQIHRQGGISVAPHPFDLRGEGISDEFVKCDAAEVFNSLNISRFENGIALKKAKKAEKPMVGGSDAHTPEMLGMTTNVMDADDMDSALKAIKKGNVRIEGKYTPVPVIVDWARERMKHSYDDILKYTEKNYSAPKAAVSRFLLNRFVNSDSAVWDGLGYFAVGTSVIYSAARRIVR